MHTVLVVPIRGGRESIYTDIKKCARQSNQFQQDIHLNAMHTVLMVPIRGGRESIYTDMKAAAGA